MYKEPTRLEIFITKRGFRICGKSVYKAFSDRLPLTGNEQALDFGSGMGTVAYYVAKRLSQGKVTCFDVSKRWQKACKKTLRRFDNAVFLEGDYSLLGSEVFDIAYCHFVLHDISDEELKKAIPALAGSLKRGGVLVFRETLDTQKYGLIRRLLQNNGLVLTESRITDVPFIGNALENIYNKENSND